MYLLVRRDSNCSCFVDLRSAFTHQDRDADGWISSMEMSRVLLTLGFKHGSQSLRRMVEIVEKEGQ
jgi:Ca2+-binding EF-hand superfamily protein